MAVRSPEQLKKEILALTREYSRTMHRESRPASDDLKESFIPGKTVVPYAGRVFTAKT